MFATGVIELFNSYSLARHICGDWILLTAFHSTFCVFWSIRIDRIRIFTVFPIPFNNVFANPGVFLRLDLFTPVYRDVCRTFCTWLVGLRIRTSQDSWYVKLPRFDELYSPQIYVHLPSLWVKLSSAVCEIGAS